MHTAAHFFFGGMHTDAQQGEGGAGAATAPGGQAQGRPQKWHREWAAE